MNPKDILAALAASANSVELAPGLRVACIKAPSEFVNVRSIFEAVDHNLRIMPPTADDDLPVSELDETLKGIQNVVGKITTQRQRNAALIGLQQAPAFRAMLSLISPDGKSIATTTEERAEMLAAFEIDPSKIQAIELAVGWDKFDADRKAKAEAEAKAAKSEAKEDATKN